MQQTVKKKDKTVWMVLFLGFLIPAAVTLAGYVVINVWPFGNGTVLIIDSLHQYLPFYTEFHEKLVNAESLFYSFSGGFGYDFWATYAYYLASPLNFLIALVPTANVCDFMDYSILFKIGVTGSIFAWYLYTRRRDGVILPVAFGCAFALGNFIIGYYFNLMWLDSIAVTPLIMRGIEKIAAGKKGWTYGLALFYGLWCNYYIGFMLCIFSVLYLFVCYLEREGISLKLILKRSIRFAVYSLLAGGMASMVLVPAFLSLTASESMQENSFPSKLKFFTDFVKIIIAHFEEQMPINISDSQVGLNIYCTCGVLILIMLYLMDTKLRVRQKLGRLLLLGFLMFSFSVNYLSYIWHGFHVQNGLPNRFAFLYVIILLCVCYDEVPRIRKAAFWEIMTAILFPLGFWIITYVLGETDTQEYGNWVLLTPAVLGVYGVLFILINRLKIRRRAAHTMIGCLIMIEAAAHGIYGFICNDNVTRSIYLEDQASFQELTESTGDDFFYRSEIDRMRMRNVTMFAGGYSTIMFNSTMQASVTHFCDQLGIEARTNKNGYNGFTELDHDIFGIRYVLTAIGNNDVLYHFSCVGSDTNLSIYRNENALSIGFMVDEAIKDWDIDDGDPLEVQNAFVQLAAGTEGIYVLDRTVEAESGEEYQVRVPQNKQVYLYLPNKVDKLELNTPEYSRTYSTYTDHVYTVNAYGDEDIADFTATFDGDGTKKVKIYTCADSALAEAVDTLSAHQLENVNVDGNRMSGSVETDKDGVLFLSIPYSDNWSVTVDGQKTDAFVIGDCMMGIDLEEGNHQISMVYVPKGFYAGLLMSVISTLLMVAAVVLENRLAGKEEKNMITFAKRCDQYKAGIFAQLNQKKQELKTEGKTVIDLSIGTPDFKPSADIMEAVSKAALISDNYKYSINDLPELISAVQDFYAARFGVELQPDEIMSVYGSQEGMAHIAWAVCDPGDIVLVPNPGYPIFKIGPELCGAATYEYPLREENGFLPKFDQIPEDICERAKMIVVNYPGNPVCATAPDAFYEELIRFAKKYNILVLHDNAYADIVFGDKQGRSLLEYEDAKDIGVEFYSLSKTFDYTGARMSFLVGNAQVVEKFRAIRSQIDYGAFLPVQYGAIAALRQPMEQAQIQCREYEERSRALCEGLRSIGWDVPDCDGTMFVWARLPKGYHNSVDFCVQLMEKAGVICTPGSSFGSLGEGYVRFALVQNPDNLREAAQRIGESGIIR